MSTATTEEQGRHQEDGAQSPEGRELVGGLSAEEIEVRLVASAGAAGIENRTLAFYLVEMQTRKLFSLLACRSAVVFAVERLEMSRRRARQLIATGRALIELPLVDKSFCSGRISWSRVRELVGVAVPETEAVWVACAEKLNWRDFRREVRRAAKGSLPGERGRGTPTTRITVLARMAVTDYALWEAARRRLEAERGGAVTDEDLVRELAGIYLSLDDEGKAPGKVRASDPMCRLVVRVDSPSGEASLVDSDGDTPVDDALVEALCCDHAATREDDSGDAPPHIPQQKGPPTPADMRGRVLARDGHCCVHCGSRSWLTAHHVRYRSRSGRTVMRNLTTLCIWCHSLVHAGLLICRGTAPNGLEFEDRRGRLLHRGNRRRYKEKGAADGTVHEKGAAGDQDAGGEQEGPGGGNQPRSPCYPGASATIHVRRRPPERPRKPRLRQEDVPDTLTSEWLAEWGDQLRFDPATGKLRVVPEGEGSWEKDGS